jgi:hypothetical protein
VPVAVTRHRDRHSAADGKSDKGDPAVRAIVLRTDMHAHRPLPADSELAQAITVFARAQQDAVWDRVEAPNKLRSHLREYFPGFPGRVRWPARRHHPPEARVILAAAAAPADAARLTLAQLRSPLRRVGRQHGIEQDAARLRAAFGQEQMRQLDAGLTVRRAATGVGSPAVVSCPIGCESSVLGRSHAVRAARR